MIIIPLDQLHFFQFTFQQNIKLHKEKTLDFQHINLKLSF